jgi:phenylacetate-CoA ligase
MADIGTALAFWRLLRDQWKSLDELQALQQTKLQKLIRHAYAKNPFYKNRFDRIGIKPEDIRTSEDLKRLPVVKKEDLRNAILESAAIPERSQWVSTSGSTGIPMRLPFLRRDHSLINLTWLRPLLAHGIPPGARTLEITGPHNFRPHSQWYQRLGLFRRRSISIFETEGRWIESLSREQPDVLWGYSGSLKLLAQFVEKNKLAIHRPRWLVGVSDLVDDSSRELMQRVFKTEVIDLYGAAETGCMSWLCPTCKEYHINIDHLLVEFIKEDHFTEFAAPSRICVTNLNSFAFPIIRYEIGDLGFFSSKKPICGRGLPLMKVIAGRSDAVIHLSSGRRLSPMFFFGAMKKVAGLANWQVIQDEPGQLIIKVIPDETNNFSKNDMEEKMLELISEPIRINIEIVQTIPEAASGKQRAVISRVPNE